VFAQPTGGAVRARPLSDYLMLTWGKIAKVVSQTPPYDQRGGVAEPQVAVWIPVALRDPGSRQERFAMFVPYLWLSNPMSLATGRELFGYPKSGGMPEFPDDGQRPQTWKLSVFGLDYSPGSVADWGHPLLEVVQNESPEDGAEAELDSLVDVARDAAGRLLDDSDVIGDFEIAESLLSDVITNRLPNVFLKQMRSVQDGLLASFQQVTQADYEVTKLSARPVPLEHQLTVHQLDSHPVITELGLESQSLGLAYSVEMGTITLARNREFHLPTLGAGAATGIDVRRVLDTGSQPVINTGIAHRLPGVGQIGAGICRAPLREALQPPLAIAPIFEGARRSRNAGGVNQQMLDRRGLLAVGSVLRHVLDDLVCTTDFSFLDEKPQG